MEVSVVRTRQEIKAIGKERFSSFYWPCVGATVLILLATAASAFTYVGALILAGPLMMGLNFFHVQLILGRNDIHVGTPFETAFQNFGRKLGGFWWMYLFLFLWALIPVAGVVTYIIKYYAYAMTPYILADCPGVKATDALKLSMRIMNGKKWKLFVFQLSFIGWLLLSALTCGILNIFYVTPYMYASTACWYLEAREDALRSGTITLGQLEGTEAV